MDRLKRELDQVKSELEAINTTRRALVAREGDLLRRQQMIHNQLSDERAMERMPAPR